MKGILNGEDQALQGGVEVVEQIEEDQASEIDSMDRTTTNSGSHLIMSRIREGLSHAVQL